jgi:hypothetical protein
MSPAISYVQLVFDLLNATSFSESARGSGTADYLFSSSDGVVRSYTDLRAISVTESHSCSNSIDIDEVDYALPLW